MNELDEAPGTYRTTKGHLYGFAGWDDGLHPLALFDNQMWAECLHASMFMASRVRSSYTAMMLEDDGLLHELLHLMTGFDICLHSSMADIRLELEELCKEFDAKVDHKHHVNKLIAYAYTPTNGSNSNG